MLLRMADCTRRQDGWPRGFIRSNSLVLTVAIVLTVWFGVVETAHGVSIGIDFIGGSEPFGAGGPVNAMQSTEIAGVVGQVFWNNAGIGATSDRYMNSIGTIPAGSILDSTGLTVSGVSLTWNCANTYSTTIPDISGNNRLMKGYLDNENGNVAVTVSNLPTSYTNQGYNLIVYFDGANTLGYYDRVSRYRVFGGPDTGSSLLGDAYGLDQGGVDFSGTFVRSTGSTIAGNYIEFFGLHAPVFTLEGMGVSGDFLRAPINGIQIVRQASAIVLSGVSNATIISGGTGTLAATISNAAESGTPNLNYTVSAAVEAGTATLGNVIPGSGSLAPGGTASNTVSAASTNVGINTIRFTASDQTAGASPQTISATLTVLDHARPALSSTSANVGRLMRGTYVAPVSTVLSNSQATYRAGLQLMDLGGMTGANVGDLIAKGGSRTLSAAIDTNTAGKYSVIHTVAVGDDQGLPGAIACPSQSFAVNYTVLDDRQVTAPANVDLGYVHYGASISQTVLLSTSGDNDHYTRVSVPNSSGPDTNGVLLSGGNPSFRFGLDGMSDSRTIAGTMNSLGSLSSTLTLAASGELGVVGTQAPPSVIVRYTAQSYSGKAEWNSNSNGSWGDQTRWKDTQSAVLGGAPGIAGFSGDTATFGNAIGSAAATVSLDGAMPIIDVLRMENTSGGSYTIVAGTGGTITLDNAAADAAITVTVGTHRIATPLVLGSNTAVTVADARDRLTISGNVSGPGGVNKDGPGTLVLNGNNSYAGDATVAAGILQGSVQSLPGNIANHGTVVFEQTADATYNGTITGTGGLVKSGAGRFIVAGADTLALSGPIAIHGGALVAPLGIAIPGLAITLGGNGTLETRGMIPRPITGTGTVAASGDLVLGSASQPGQFRLGGSAGTGGTLNAGANAVILLSADAAILGTRTSLGDGGSLTTLHGAQLGNEFSLDATKLLSALGSATINGDFINNGLVQGPVGSEQWLTFTQDVKGAGSTTGHVYYAGAYSPGNSPALVSAETIAFGSTSSLVMEIGGSMAGSQYDQLDLYGMATLDGTLKVNLLNGYELEPGHSYELIAGRTTGQFDQVGGLPGGWYVDYKPNGLFVVPEPSSLALLCVAALGLLACVLRPRNSI